MGTYVVTGSASGIGAATAALLSSQGHRVVGVDRRDADVVADLGTPAGRQHAVEEVLRRADGRVNAVAPGLVATAMTDDVRADPVFGRFADTYPTALARPGRPEEVAALIGFLLSEQASLMVGSVVFADGGTDALRHPRRPTTRYVPQ